MASEWESGMGVGFGIGIGAGVPPSLAAPTPNYATAMNSAAYLYGLPSTDTLRIDDLLDFSTHEATAMAGGRAIDHPQQQQLLLQQESGSTSDYHMHSHSHSHSHSRVSSFADDLYVPSEEAAELEWLSKFVEDSFSDVPYGGASAGCYVPASANPQAMVDPTSPAVVSGVRGARSKRTRVAPSTGLKQSSSSSSTSSSSSSEFPAPPPGHILNNSRRKATNAVGGEQAGGGLGVDGGGVRRCTHCASEKTPQWRTGPLGPKTLCNACGVRYKSGRLVPEYRPAASPSFVLTQHSNSHRKVMELRRQKEQQQHLHLLRHQDNNNNASY